MMNCNKTLYPVKQNKTDKWAENRNKIYTKKKIEIAKHKIYSTF